MYWIKAKNNIHGPYSLESIKEKYQVNDIFATDLYSETKLGPWRAVSKLLPYNLINSGSTNKSASDEFLLSIDKRKKLNQRSERKSLDILETSKSKATEPRTKELGIGETLNAPADSGDPAQQSRDQEISIDSTSLSHQPNRPSKPRSHNARLRLVSVIAGTAALAILLVCYLWVPAAAKLVAGLQNSGLIEELEALKQELPFGNEEPGAPSPVEEISSEDANREELEKLKQEIEDLKSNIEGNEDPPTPPMEDDRPPINDPPDEKPKLPKGFTADAIADYERSVVVIRTDVGTLGSGVLIDNDTILTNHHVVDGIGSARIEFQNGDTFKVDGFTFANMGFDIAFLKARIQSDYAKPLPLVETHLDLQKGMEVIALGSPRGNEFTVTKGIVSRITDGDGTAASWSNIEGIPGVYDSMGFSRECRWIQHDAQIDKGNSGGPIVNVDGKVLGINTVGLKNEDTGRIYNFAIETSQLRSWMETGINGPIAGFNKLPTKQSQIAKLPGPLPPGIIGGRPKVKGTPEEIVAATLKYEEITDRIVEAERELSYLNEELLPLRNQINQINIQLRRFKQIRLQTNRKWISTYRSAYWGQQLAHVDNCIYQLRASGTRAQNEILAIEERGYELQRFLEELFEAQRTMMELWVKLVDPAGSLLQGDFDQVVTECNAWIRLTDHNFFEPYILRGIAEARMGRIKEGLADLSEALRLVPANELRDQMIIHCTKAMIYIEDGRYLEAMELADEAANLQQHDVLPMGLKAVSAFNQGQTEVAADFFREALTKNRADENQYLHLNYAGFLAMCTNKDFRNAQLALEHAEIALGISGKDSPDALFIKSVAHAEDGDFDNAIISIEAAIRFASNPVTVVTYRRFRNAYIAGKPLRYLDNKIQVMP